MSEDRRAEVIEKVRDILVSDWDPIGVGGNPNLRDEYDDALSPIVSALSKNPDQRALIDVLVGMEEQYHVEGSDEARRRAVIKLLVLRESIADWPAA
jgi:hypothetical protein